MAPKESDDHEMYRTFLATRHVTGHGESFVFAVSTVVVRNERCDRARNPVGHRAEK